MILSRIIILASMLLAAAAANAGEWKFGVGVSHVSGMSDVLDIYEKNFEAENSFTEVELVGIPIGPGFVSRYLADSGLMFNIGIGPGLIILGDLSHTEIPVSATIGYMFSRGGNSSPYIRLGVVAHSVSGDYVVTSDPGSLAAIGMEFGLNRGLNWGIELSADDSTVEFLDLTKSGNTELNTYDRLLTLFFLF